MRDSHVPRVETGSRMMIVTGAERKGDWKLLFNGYRLSVWDDEKILEIDGGDGCTTL